MGLDRLRLQGPCASQNQAEHCPTVQGPESKAMLQATGGEIRVEVSHIFKYFPMLL